MVHLCGPVVVLRPILGVQISLVVHILVGATLIREHTDGYASALGQLGFDRRDAGAIELIFSLVIHCARTGEHKAALEIRFDLGRTIGRRIRQRPVISRGITRLSKCASVIIHILQPVVFEPRVKVIHGIDNAGVNKSLRITLCFTIYPCFAQGRQLFADLVGVGVAPAVLSDIDIGIFAVDRCALVNGAESRCVEIHAEKRISRNIIREVAVDRFSRGKIEAFTDL